MAGPEPTEGVTVALTWTMTNNAAAIKEGWCIRFHKNNKRCLYINRGWLNYPELHQHILSQAKRHSPLHLKALAFLFVHNKNEYFMIVERLPPNTGGELVKLIHTMARVAGSISGETK